MRTWQVSYRGLIPQDYLDSFELAPRIIRWEKILNGNTPTGLNNTFVHISDDGVVTGFVSVGSGRDEKSPYPFELYALYVQADLQRQGIGAKLFAAGVEHLKNFDAKGMFLWTLKENKPTRAFYERMGGRVFSEKSEDIGATPIVEVAYAYDF